MIVSGVSNRTPLHRPYFFEVFSVANLLLLQVLVLPLTRGPVASLASDAALLLPTFAADLIIGVVIRLAAGWYDGSAGAYLQTLRSRRWLFDSARLLVFAVVTAHAYAWIKLLIPLIHPRLFDQQLWNLETHLFAGYSPTVMVLSLFSNPPFVRAIDITYGNAFIVSMNVAFAWFLSSPSRRLRIAFTDSNAFLWIVGAWLYVMVPSLGPAYRFQDVWMPYAPLLTETRGLQKALLENYRLVINPRLNPGARVNVLLGIAAFPSLHVAFEVFVLLWLRRVWRAGQLIFAAFAILIFIGSMVTGWHYFIDSVAGVILAVVAYAIFARVHHIGRLLELWRETRLRSRQEVRAMTSV